MESITRRIAVVGIDGSGKSTVARRFLELANGHAGEVVAMTCPAYHETPDVPLSILSRQLAALSTAADEAGIYELKAVALFLQMTLYGPVERFLRETYEPRFLLSERHALIDTLAYGRFYSQMLRAPIERAALEGPVRERLEAFQPGSFAAILRWFGAENRRLGQDFPFHEMPSHLRSLFELPWSDLIPELMRQYRADLPDVVLWLDLDPSEAHRRLAGRRGAPPELHETRPVLERLRRGYENVIGILRTICPEVEAVTIPAGDDRGADETLREILERAGIEAAHA